MKSLAAVQLIIAVIAAIALAPPSIYLLSAPLGILVALVVWGVGLYLIAGYYKISTGIIREQHSFGVWLLSFCFNLPGSLIALGYAVAGFSNTNGASSWDLGGVVLFCLPAILGTILGIIGCSSSNRPHSTKPNAAQIRQL
jgi:hypothetical protein